MNVAFAAETFDLRGAWYRSEGYYTEKPIEFVLINEEYRTYTQEQFVNQWRQVLYTIDQTLKLTKSSETTFKGTVDFFDSRGCSFKALPVSGEVQNTNVIGILMTVPRYKFRTVTKAQTGEIIRTECRVLEYVEVPVSLYRY